MTWPFLASHTEGTILRLRVTPNASRSEIAGVVPDGMGGQRLTVRLQAPPVEGKANRAACRWAAQFAGLREAQVRILRGEKAREKDLLLTGVKAGDLDESLRRALEPGGGGPSGR